MGNWMYEFETSGFRDDERMAAGRVNEDIGGFALAVWLAGELQARGVDASAPWYEDHGADLELSHDGRLYSCVVCVDEDGAAIRSARVAVGQERTLMDKLWGRNKPENGDKIGEIVRGALAGHPAIHNLVCV